MVDKSHQILNRIHEQFRNVSQRVAVGTNPPAVPNMADRIPNFGAMVGANGHGIRQIDAKPHMVGANGHGIRRIDPATIPIPNSSGNYIDRDKARSERKAAHLTMGFNKPFHLTKEQIEAHMKPRQFIGTRIGHMPVRQK